MFNAIRAPGIAPAGSTPFPHLQVLVTFYGIASRRYHYRDEMVLMDDRQYVLELVEVLKARQSHSGRSVMLKLLEFRGFSKVKAGSDDAVISSVRDVAEDIVWDTRLDWWVGRLRLRVFVVGQRHNQDFPIYVLPSLCATDGSSEQLQYSIDGMIASNALRNASAERLLASTAKLCEESVKSLPGLVASICPYLPAAPSPLTSHQALVSSLIKGLSSLTPIFPTYLLPLTETYTKIILRAPWTSARTSPRNWNPSSSWPSPRKARRRRS